MAKITDQPGMQTSIMPLREMHGLNAIGKGTQIDFDDPEKTIKMGFEVVEASAINKVKKGVLPCFSQGGNYAEKWADPKDKKLTRYAADPGEVSLVDRGCLPSAVIESIKNQTFQFVKSNGSIELRKFAIEMAAQDNGAPLTKADLAEFARTFGEALDQSLERRLAKEAKTKRKGGKDLHASDFAYVGDPDDTSTWKLPIHDAAHVRNALARFNQTQGIPADEKKKVKAKITAAAHKHGIEVSGEAEKLMRAVQYLQAAVGEAEMEKGLYQVGAMAEILETIAWLQSSTAYERDFEGDASTEPEDLKALLEDAIACFTAMVEEETGELADSAAAIVAKGDTAMTPEQLKKAAAHISALHGHLKAAVAAHEAHGTAMSGHLGKAMECCNKALSDGGGAEHFNAGGSGPTATDIRVGGDGSGAHTSKVDYVSIGKNAEGVELFKAVPKESEPINVDELLAKIDKRMDDNMTVFLKAAFAAMNGTEMQRSEPTGGVGDRTLVIPTGQPAATQVVTKAADATSGGAGAGTAGASAKPSTELFKAGLAGDMDKRLEFARTIKRMGPADTSRVQSNLSTFARH